MNITTLMYKVNADKLLQRLLNQLSADETERVLEEMRRQVRENV